MLAKTSYCGCIPNNAMLLLVTPPETNLPRIVVDLDRPPRERWEGLRPHRQAIRSLVDVYLRDLGGLDELRAMLELAAPIITIADVLPGEHGEELEAISQLVGVSLEELALANAYYDLASAALGCTAVGLDLEGGPIHARNLDWWGEGGVLGRHTVAIEYVRGGRRHFEVIGWPGSIGAFSGIAPGRFSISLNAVSSGEAPQLALPITVRLRELLDHASSFDVALMDLERVPLPCSALLMLVGTKPGELAVIERTPTRAAVRRGIGREGEQAVLATNDYRALATKVGDANVLSTTSCSRFDRALERAVHERPSTVAGWLAILDDPEVRMDITAQQMVFRPVTGECWARGRT